MADLWKKLNLKDQPQVVVVNAPPSFEEEIGRLESTQVVRSCGKAMRIEFVLAFVTKRSEIKRIAEQVAKKSEGDTVVWFAYPKQTSKKYACEFNRDSGWEPVTQAGFEGVRMVAIDEDWSALRFRRAEFVKSKSRQPSSARSVPRTKPAVALAKLREICLKLPDTQETLTWGQPHFRVGGKIFAGLGDEDGTPTMGCKLESVHAAKIVEMPGFSRAPYVGHKGWVSIDLSVVKDWKLVRELATESYCLIAPKRSIKKLDR